MESVFTRFSRAAIILTLASASLFGTSISNAAESIDAYKYVTAICAEGQALPLWSPNQKDELALGLENLGAGFYDAVIDTQSLVSRLRNDPYTEQMKSLLESDGFRMGLHDCFPDSEIKRNLLAIRIVMTGAGSYMTGVGVGFYTGLKLFTVVAKALGTATAGTLRYIGVSEKAIMGLGKATRIAGVSAAGIMTLAMVAPEVEKAYHRYQLAKERNENRNDNLNEIYKLSGLSSEILGLMETANQEDHSKLQGQLTRVSQLIQKRIEMI